MRIRGETIFLCVVLLPECTCVVDLFLTCPCLAYEGLTAADRERVHFNFACGTLSPADALAQCGGARGAGAAGPAPA